MEPGKLRWRCRRGMKELDFLLTRYAEKSFGGAPDLERDAFEELLATEDALLYAYCLGSQAPPGRFADLIARITAATPRSPPDPAPSG